MPYTPDAWRDGTPGFDVTAARMTKLGQQYAAVAADADDPTTPVGAAVARAASAGGGGGGYTDNGDGTLTLRTGSFTDNGDGTITLGG